MRHWGPIAASIAVAAVLIVALSSQAALGRLASSPATDQPAARAPAVGAAISAAPSATPTPRAQVHLAEGTVKQYGRLKLSAEGFAPGESLTITVKPEGDAQPVELGHVQADDQGGIAEFAADLPEAITSGPRPVTVAGATSQRQATAVLYVRSQKLFAVLNGYTPRPAEKLGFVVGGFEPGEDVQVFFGDTTGTPLLTVPTDQAGNTAWTEVAMPVVRPGKYDLIFQGSQGQNKLTQTITISPLTPTLELSPWSGPAGTKLELNGRGFLAGEDVQVYLGNGDQPVSSFKADQYGNFWGIGPLVVPVDSGPGKAAVRLVGQSSGAEVTQSFAVVGGKPWAELSAYSGLPGSVVRFAGGGFGARERVSVHLGNGSGPIVATAETDEQGNVVRSDVASVPADSTATTQTPVTFTLVGESSRSEASAVFTVIPPVVPNWARERPPAQ